MDTEGSDEEDPEDCWAQLRECDLVSLLSQVPVDHMFRYVLRVEIRDGADVYNVREGFNKLIWSLTKEQTERESFPQ